MTLGDLVVSSDSMYLAATYSGSATIASTTVGTTDSGATQAYAAGLILSLTTHTNVGHRQFFMEGLFQGCEGCLGRLHAQSASAVGLHASSFLPLRP